MSEVSRSISDRTSARLLSRPVRKLSSTRTEQSPRASRERTRLEPIKPAPPVTRNRVGNFLVYEREPTSLATDYGFVGVASSLIDIIGLQLRPGIRLLLRLVLGNAIALLNAAYQLILL